MAVDGGRERWDLDGGTRMEAGSEEDGDVRMAALEAAVEEMHGLARDFGGAWISDVYSPPRVTHELWKQRLPAGTAFDLTTCDERGRPWDFSAKERMEEARRRIEEGSPWLLIGSPMCKALSRLLNIVKRETG